MAWMGMSEDLARFLYLSINLFIFLSTFSLSFHRSVSFWRRWGALLPAYLAISLPFIVWDLFMIKYDHWGFDPAYIVGWRLFHAIPVEEVLFFFTVPYACTFTYEAIRTFVPERRVPFSRIPYVLTGIVSIGAAVPFWHQPYTASVLVMLGIVLIGSPFIAPDLFRNTGFFAFLIGATFLFVAFNYLLTSIPIVWYWHGSIWGGDGAWNGRFITIPYEDFIYNFALLIGFLAVYHKFRGTPIEGPGRTRTGTSD